MGKMRTQSRSLWRFVAIPAFIAAIVSFVFIADVSAKSKKQTRPGSEERSIATPTFIHTGRAPLPPPTGAARSVEPSVVDPLTMEAGHVLRRLGFGPSKKELKIYKKKGFMGYLNEQMSPNSIDDSKANNKMPNVPDDEDKVYDSDMIRRWYIRMVWTRRVLQEKMTLIWHEHFATSMEKVGSGALMLEHEDILRQNSLGNFRDFLINMSKDQAMLLWLDNDYNRGNLYDIPTDTGTKPNENYGREFLQLFSTGTVILNIDGTPVLDGGGNEIPAYDEADVLHVALAMTGWNVPYPRRWDNVEFRPCIHNDDDKVLFAADSQGGITIPGHAECDPAGEVETAGVVDAVLTRRADTVAAFISKMLIQKLVTETPTPQYVAAVATVFRDSGWDIKQAVNIILTYDDPNSAFVGPEFLDPLNMRSMHKEPIEYAIGAIRAFNGKTKDFELLDWTYDMGQLAYWPPSVFSFYPPGNRGALVSTAYVFIRDRVADEYTRGWSDTYFNPDKLITKFNLINAEDAVSYLEERMLAYPIDTAVRDVLINGYMGGPLAPIDATKLRGLIWAVMTSPDYQRN